MDARLTPVSKAFHPANAYNVGEHVRTIYRDTERGGFVAYAVRNGEIIAEAEGGSEFAAAIALQKELNRLRDSLRVAV